jgi:hypothetical protein
VQIPGAFKQPLFSSPSSPNVLSCDSDATEPCCVDFGTGLVHLSARVSSPTGPQTVAFFSDQGCQAPSLISTTVISVTDPYVDSYLYSFVDFEAVPGGGVAARSMQFGTPSQGVLLSGEYGSHEALACCAGAGLAIGSVNTARQFTICAALC